MSSRRRLLVVDANVLIDYAASDVTILGLAARHLGSLFVPRPLLDEVAQLTEAECGRLGLQIVDPAIEHLLEAGQGRGRLSFHDRLCLILARDQGWTCVTNDKALRNACAELAVPVLWGLELLVELVGLDQLTPRAAVEVAKAIRAGNPLHLTAEILERFERRLEEVRV